MKPYTAKQKGKNFENWCAKQIEEMGLGKAGREIGSGSGKMKGDIRSNLPFLLECKNQRAVKWWEFIGQAKSQAQIGNYDKEKWALIVKDPKSVDPTYTSTGETIAYAVISYHEFLKLLKKEKESIIKQPDKELKWRLQKLKQLSGEVERSL